MLDHPSAILLFAAGFGTRMAPLTDTQPKPLIPVAGKSLIDHALQYCSGLRQVVNVHYRATQMRAHLQGRGVLISDETDEIRETGGGLKHALPLLDSNPVLTMNTDAVWQGPNPIETLLAKAAPDDAEALLLLVPREQAIGHIGTSGFDMDADGRLTKGPGYIYTGLQLIRTDGLCRIEERAFSMWVLWTDMLARGTVYGVVYDGQWCDVGRPSSIELAEAMLNGATDV